MISDIWFFGGSDIWYLIFRGSNICYLAVSQASTGDNEVKLMMKHSPPPPPEFELVTQWSEFQHATVGLRCRVMDAHNYHPKEVKCHNLRKDKFLNKFPKMLSSTWSCWQIDERNTWLERFLVLFLSDFWCYFWVISGVILPALGDFWCYLHPTRPPVYWLGSSSRCRASGNATKLTRLLGRPQPQMYPPVALNQYSQQNS